MRYFHSWFNIIKHIRTFCSQLWRAIFTILFNVRYGFSHIYVLLWPRFFFVALFAIPWSIRYHQPCLCFFFVWHDFLDNAHILVVIDNQIQKTKKKKILQLNPNHGSPTYYKTQTKQTMMIECSRFFFHFIHFFSCFGTYNTTTDTRKIITITIIYVIYCDSYQTHTHTQTKTNLVCCCVESVFSSYFKMFSIGVGVYR